MGYMRLFFRVIVLLGGLICLLNVESYLVSSNTETYFPEKLISTLQFSVLPDPRMYY